MAQAAIIADAGPLICIARAGGLRWLHELLGEVSLTAEIAGEVLVPGKPGAAAIEAAIESGWLSVSRTPSPPVPALDKFRLDPGEYSALACAWASGGNCLLILDDLEARKAARELKIKFVGTVGLLIQARKQGLIASFSDAIDTLLSNGFFVSPELIKKGLELCDELRRDPGSPKDGKK